MDMILVLDILGWLLLERFFDGPCWKQDNEIVLQQQKEQGRDDGPRMTRQVTVGRRQSVKTNVPKFIKGLSIVIG